MDITITYDRTTQAIALKQYMDLRDFGIRLAGIAIDDETFVITLTLEIETAEVK